MKKDVRSETPAEYLVSPDTSKDDDIIIQKALLIMLDRMREPGQLLDNPDLAKKYAFLKLADEPSEIFCCLFLDNRHRAIAFTRMFHGTIDGASVHPREVVRLAIQHNAAAVILVHNHPSGVPDPSQADIRLTRRLVDSLALIDVRVIDHLVVGDHHDCYSFAEAGLL